MSINPQRLVSRVSKLVPLPEVCVRLNSMIADPRYSAADIGEVVSKDPSLTANLLRIANSPFYGFSKKIETVNRAITVIGQRQLYDLILALSSVKALSKFTIELMDITEFWRHSVHCGIVARMLASKTGVLHAERLFVAGLLHNIGQLIILGKIPELARVVFYRQRLCGTLFHQAEQEVYQADHGSIGAELMRAWHFPDSLQWTTEFHHEPGKAGDFQLEASIVHIADIVTEQLEWNDQEGDSAQPKVSPVAWEVTGLTREVVDSVLEEAVPLFADALAVILPSAKRAYH